MGPYYVFVLIFVLPVVTIVPGFRTPTKSPVTETSKNSIIRNILDTIRRNHVEYSDENSETTVQATQKPDNQVAGRRNLGNVLKDIQKVRIKIRKQSNKVREKYFDHSHNKKKKKHKSKHSTKRKHHKSKHAVGNTDNQPNETTGKNTTETNCETEDQREPNVTNKTPKVTDLKHANNANNTLSDNLSKEKEDNYIKSTKPADETNGLKKRAETIDQIDKPDKKGNILDDSSKNQKVERRHHARHNHEESDTEESSEVEPKRNLDMIEARGGRINYLRGKNRLCQRHQLWPEGPKYNSRGYKYLEEYPKDALRPYGITKVPDLFLPKCCNCCKKSVLGCE